MKKTHIIFLFSLLLSNIFFAQKNTKDTISSVKLEEIILVTKAGLKNQKQVKPLASIDDYLEKSGKVTMIKRGNYAWEASMNNMLSERLSITIGGMQIFGACTDKMDPITSYVDVSNIEEVKITSGQHGVENGSTIGGSIDLKLQKSTFNNEFNIGLDTGFESNSNTKITSGELNYATEKVFINTDIVYRDAENYFAGNNTQVPFSQYTKYNIATVAGYKLNNASSLETSIIFDKATNVGYPALTMDVSLARALITSVAYKKEFTNQTVQKWETKLYYNTITHVMDDTKRPNVPIHMDMPGWSDTYGFYSKFYGKKNNHQFKLNINGYYNKSLAEMTMYPNNPNENNMFMLTWPDVRTIYSGVFAEDTFSVKKNQTFTFSARMGFQNSTVADELGLNSLRIFYPNLSKNTARFLISTSSKYTIKHKNTVVTLGLGYGERAPSVTEAYGFYLYNSFDNYDYVGNPNLKNEKSLETSLNFNYKKGRFSLHTDVSLFYMMNYIIGKTDTSLTQMTINADGVRIYTALQHAIITNSSIKISYKFTPRFSIDSFTSYSLGKDNNGNYLPLISPLGYGINLSYSNNSFNAEVGLLGAGNQENFSSYYGENRTNAYAIYHLNTSYQFLFDNTKLYVKSGVENLFDTYYSTYSDWRNIPRMGRNFFINVSYIIK